MSRTTHRARREQKRRRQKLQNLRKRQYLQKVLKRIDSGSPEPVSSSAMAMIQVTSRRYDFDRYRLMITSPRPGRSQNKRRKLIRQNPHLRAKYKK